MNGDKELFEMMRSRRCGGKLPGKTVHFIPEETAPAVLAIDSRIQQIRKYRGLFIAGTILLAFLLGVRM